MKPFLVLPILIFSMLSYNSSVAQPQTGKIDGELYTNKLMGWTIKIPKGWTVMQKDKVEETFEVGAKAIEEASDQNFDYSGLKYLANFKKNRFNIFQSTAEFFELQYEGHWEENNAYQRKLLIDTYKNQGLKIETSSSEAKIDGLEFRVFHIKILKPGGGGVLLYQDVYNRYINNHDFTVILNYNNEEDKNAMLNVWKASKFKKRNN